MPWGRPPTDAPVAAPARCARPCDNEGCPTLARVLREKLQAAFDTVVPGADPTLRPSERADFQANGALALAKQVGRPASDIAEDVAAAVSARRHVRRGRGQRARVHQPDPVRRLRGRRSCRSLSADARLGVDPAAQPETVVVDYSAPNVAKEMHVGHLRSTLIGDSLARILGFLGHTVLRENHIGDWGTPFGMLIEHLLDVDGAERAESFSVRDLNEFYAAARRQFDCGPGLRRAQPAPGRAPPERRRGDVARCGASSWPRACATPKRSTACSACC